MRPSSVIALLVLALSTTGCGQDGPVGPSSPGLARPVGAAIQLTNISVQTSISELSGDYVYSVGASLEETSGRAGAQVTAVRLESPRNLWGPGRTAFDESTEGICWDWPIRVEAGDTLDLFSWDALAYCAPVMNFPTPLPYVVLTVTYFDDANQTGTVSAQIDIPN